MEKDEQAARNIGDPSVFLGVFDAHEEEQMTGKAIEENLEPAEFNRRMAKAAEDDLLAILFGDTPVPAGLTVRRPLPYVPQPLSRRSGLLPRGPLRR